MVPVRVRVFEGSTPIAPPPELMATGIFEELLVPSRKRVAFVEEYGEAVPMTTGLGLVPSG
jgi:hypothetical protein